MRGREYEITASLCGKGRITARFYGKIPFSIITKLSFTYADGSSLLRE